MSQSREESPIMEATDATVALGGATSLIWMQELDLSVRILATIAGIAFLALRGYLLWLTTRREQKEQSHEEKR